MKKLVSESINETFAEATEGSKPEEISVPKYSIFQFDWKADPDEIIESLEHALATFGLVVTWHPGFDNSDQYGYIISGEDLDEEQVAEIANDSE